MGVRVLLLTNDLATVTAVSTAMKSSGELDWGHVCHSPGECASHLEQTALPVALIDIDGEPKRMLAAIESLTRRFSQTRFVVLSGNLQNDLLLEAMQVGARHYMVKESIAADLVGVLKRLSPLNGREAHGKAVTVLSAGGGCGATTVAVNLAAELSIIGSTSDPARSVIVDLDHNYGAVAAYFGVDGEYGVMDLLNRDGPIDAQLVQSTANVSNGRPAVLISTPRGRIGEAISLDPRRINQLVESCKASYTWTVIDAARVPNSVAVDLASHSSATLLLFQPTIKDIRIARQTLTTLMTRGILADSVRLIMTRFRKRKTRIGLEEAREAMGLAPATPLTCFSNDYYTVTEAVNLGKTLAQAAPRSDFRRELQKLATSLVELQATVSRP